MIGKRKMWLEYEQSRRITSSVLFRHWRSWSIMSNSKLLLIKRYENNHLWRKSSSKRSMGTNKQTKRNSVESHRIDRMYSMTLSCRRKRKNLFALIVWLMVISIQLFSQSCFHQQKISISLLFDSNLRCSFFFFPRLVEP